MKSISFIAVTSFCILFRIASSFSSPAVVTGFRSGSVHHSDISILRSIPHQKHTHHNSLKQAKRQGLTQLNAAAIVLPSLKAVSLACLLPTCLGYYKREYGVSYAYGTATALTAAMVFKSLSAATGGISLTPFSLISLAQCHACAVIFYGTRLNLFLAYRQIFVPRIQEIQKGIEERATKNENSLLSRLSRTPFIVSCALLYFGLCSPFFLTSGMAAIIDNTSSITTPIIQLVLRALISFTWFGFVLAALGDLQKSLTKGLTKNENRLVTGGIYKILRHPNYTGEIIGWTCSSLAGLIAAGVTLLRMKGGSFTNMNRLAVVGHTVMSLIGVAGINFVLMAATANLEKKQKEQYGQSEEYNHWIKASWSGPKLKKKEDNKVDLVEPKIEFSPEQDQADGLGI